MSVDEYGYPTEISAECLERNARISDSEITRDIADTEAEIRKLEQIMSAETTLAENEMSDQGRRMAAFKREARPHQIAKRRAFVEFLQKLQTARKEDNQYV